MRVPDKALGLLVHLAGGGLVCLVARRLGAERRQALGGAYLFVCNPLLIWEMIGNAHNDGLMLLTCGPFENTVRFVPPLIVNASQVEDALRIVEKSLSAA